MTHFPLFTVYNSLGDDDQGIMAIRQASGSDMELSGQGGLMVVCYWLVLYTVIKRKLFIFVSRALIISMHF